MLEAPCHVKGHEKIKTLTFSSTTNIPKRDRETFLWHISVLETIKLLADELRHNFLINGAYRMNERKEVIHGLEHWHAILNGFTGGKKT